jgi:hypothetical protein
MCIPIRPHAYTHSHMDLSDALAFACAHHFVQIHPVLTTITRPVTLTEGNVSDSAPRATWLAAGAHWFTLIKHNKHTLVYSHETHMTYYAAPEVQLHEGMPDGYAFLAQTALDDGTVPRLLIVDILQPVFASAGERGEQLRKMHGLFQSSCHVQWAGEAGSLRRFLRDAKLPHAVAGVIAWHDPWRITVHAKTTRKCSSDTAGQ